MTKEEFQIMVDRIHGGEMIFDNEIVLVERDIIDSVVRKIVKNMNYRNVDDHIDATKLLVEANKEFNPYYCEDKTYMDVVSNYCWLSKLIDYLSDTGIVIIPDYETIKLNGEEDYVFNIMDRTRHIFLEIMRTTLNKVKGFISSRVHVELRDGIITCMDGSYIDIDDGIVKYGTDIDKLARVVYTGGEVTMSYVLNRRGHEATDITISNVIRIYVAYTIALNHNIACRCLAIGDRDLIDTNRIISIIKDGNGMVGIKRYVDELTDNIVKVANRTRDNLLGYVATGELSYLYGDYTIIQANKVNIDKICPSNGILIMVNDNRVEVTLKDKFDVHYVVLEFILVSVVRKGSINIVIDNLCMGEGTKVFNIIRDEFKTLGLLDLYSQSPVLLDRRIGDFFASRRHMVFVNNIPAQGEPSYFITKDSLIIGYLEGCTFNGVVLIGTFENTLPSYTIRFNSPPNVRKITNRTKEALKRYLEPEHYVMFKNLIDL